MTLVSVPRQTHLAADGPNLSRGERGAIPTATVHELRVGPSNYSTVLENAELVHA